MRNAFIRALTEVAEKDERIVFLTADLGYKLFDDFARRCPGRFLNVGVAEANMAGVASGLALEHKKPFIYSIVPFVALRCYEQIRNDIAYHEAGVTVVGVGGGFSYGPNGPTHHALEDVGALRLIPNMTVLCPGDPFETEAAVRAVARESGPAYLRLGRAGERNVHQGPVEIELGKGLRLREGKDVAIVACGSMLANALDAADLLAADGLRCTLVSMPTVKPLDVALVDELAARTGCIVTVEEHSIIGGLGSAVAEHLAERGGAVQFRRFGAEDAFAHECGEQSFHRRRNGLDPNGLAAAIGAFVRGRLPS